VFFCEQSAESLAQAMELFESRRAVFDPQAIRAHVAGFDLVSFKERVKAFAIAALAGTGR
jgi:hypothetical protein